MKPERVMPRRSLIEIAKDFATRVAKISQVKKVLLSQERETANIWTVFYSMDPKVRFGIYEVEQEILLSEEETRLDFHTINLADYESQIWSSLIPSGVEVLFER